MTKVIRSYNKFSEHKQEEIYAMYVNNELERTNFPFKGEISSGVIYPDGDSIFLIPISTILSNYNSRVEGMDDDDDDSTDDDDMDDLEDDSSDD